MHADCPPPFHMLNYSPRSPEQHPFVLSITWQLHGALDTARLHAAWRQLVASTPMLRTRFDLQALPQPRQVVEPTAELIAS